MPSGSSASEVGAATVLTFVVENGINSRVTAGFATIKVVSHLKVFVSRKCSRASVISFEVCLFMCCAVLRHCFRPGTIQVHMDIWISMHKASCARSGRSNCSFPQCLPNSTQHFQALPPESELPNKRCNSTVWCHSPLTQRPRP